MGYDKRRPNDAFYSTRQWRDRLRPLQLSKQPLCAHCIDRGEITLAMDVDHKIPHNGNYWLQRDPDNLQSLCKACHTRKTRGKAPKTYSERVDPATGYMVDPRHPTNRKTG